MAENDENPSISSSFPPMADRLVTICDTIKSLGLTPKEFVQNFLINKDSRIKEQRGKWAIKKGWKTTKELVLTIGKLVKADKNDGVERWSNELILEEAQEIVKHQDLPSGNPPDGMYYHAHNITHEFFNEEEDDKRTKIIEQHMSFLHSLIKSKLEYATEIRDARNPDRLEKRDGREQEEIELEGDIDGDINLKRSTNALPQIEEHRLKKLPSTICSMIAFACNRCHSGMQLQNSLTLLACGVTEKVNSFLHFLGLTMSRKTANETLDTLKRITEAKIKSVSARAHKIRPLLCIDNIDIQQSVHDGNVDSTKKTLHGTWGYLHVVPEHLTKDLSPEDLSLKTLCNAMENSKSLPIDLHDFLPTNNEEIHFTLARKAQIVNALLELVLDKDSKAHKHCKSKLTTSPPPVDPIQMYKPEIYMLKLMTASENSAVGIGQVLDQLIGQLGLDPKEFSSQVQVVEGDLGTVRNINSAERKRFPAGHPEESLQNLIRNLAGAHTMWNLTSGIVGLHIGDPKDSQDPGIYRCATSLGIKADKLFDKKDFGLLMTAVHKIHSATLAFLLKQFISSKGSDFDLTKPKVAQSLIDEVFDNYFTGQSIRAAKDAQDNALYNLRLRLRDFATIIEADQAMRAGDIGRLMSMWKRWAIMAQGIKKLSAYAIHLPKYILVLEKYLPPKFARVIKHCLLIPSSGRDGHWVAKDFYLEIQNYWIKYFYNNSGQGTDLDRLIERFSLNIPLLHSLIHQLCLRSGLQHVYQNNKHPISSASLTQFMHFARDHLADPNLIKTERKNDILEPVNDVRVKGIKKFQSILRDENMKGESSRFGWGYLLNLDEDE